MNDCMADMSLPCNATTFHTPHPYMAAGTSEFSSHSVSISVRFSIYQDIAVYFSLLW